MLRESGNVVYLQSIAPTYYGSVLQYYGDGSDFFKAMKTSLTSAKNFIFMEFFTLKSGVMLTEVLDILESKAREGVKIYILCDNIGSFCRISAKDIKRMHRCGIRFRFSIPILSRWIRYANNRDHNKLIVVDGRLALTGGINIADNYINAKKKQPYWKDGGVLIKGSAVRGFANIFVKMWNLQSDTKLNITYKNNNLCQSGSLCIPFLNLPKPIDDERVARNTYLNMINLAKEYLYIATPYFACDEELINAVCLAAKRGVDVHLIIPGRPDHILVYCIGQQNMPRLLRSGVHVHEFMPGMIHIKNITADHEYAIIGSINYDYRSMDIDFEVGCLTNDQNFINDMENDFKNVIKKSRKISQKDCKKANILTILSKIIEKQM